MTGLEWCGDCGICGVMFLSFARLAALLHQFGDNAGPSRLMASADSGARVSVKVFVEQDQIAPVRISLEFFEIAEDRPAAFIVSKKYIRHSTGQFTGYIPQSQHFSRPGWEFHCEAISEVMVELL